MKLKKDTRGMTLVEVIVSIALFTLGSVILVSGFGAAGGLFRHGTDLKNGGQRVAAVVEGAPSDADVEQVPSTPESGRISFLADGTPIEIVVEYETMQDIKDPEIKFKTFEILPEESD